MKILRHVLMAAWLISLSKQVCEFCNRCQNDECLECMTGYELISGVCSADPCRYVNKTSLRCLECKGGYVNQRGTCLISKCLFQSSPNFCMQCAPRYIVNLDTRLCDPVNCRTFDPQSRECLRCFSGYVAINGQCEPLNCIRIQNTGFCSLCKEGYKFNNGNLCIPMNCLRFNEQLQCVSCTKGFILQRLSVRNQSVAVCNSNSNYCNNIISSSQPYCKSCFPGYEVVDGECVKSVDGCQQLNWFGCAICMPLFINDNFYCVPRFCEIYNPNKLTQCQQCHPGFELFSLSGRTLCRASNCAVFSNDGISCNSCFSRFYKRNQVCVTLNCQTFTETTCVLCEPSFELRNGSCILANCMNPKQLICQDCVDGWSKDPAGLCTIQICLKFQMIDSGKPKCVFCPYGRRLQNATCIKDTCLLKYTDGLCRQCPALYRLTLNSYFCIPNKCSQYDQNTGQCTKCAHGFWMNKKLNSQYLCQHIRCLEYRLIIGMAEPQCVSCSWGYEPFDTYCIPQFCLNYDVFSGNCLQCSSGYQPAKDGNQSVCGIANCELHATPQQLSVNISRKCLKCAAGFTIERNQTAQSCVTRNCAVFIDKSRICSQCNLGYFLLKQSNNHSVCYAQFCWNYDALLNCRECVYGFALTSTQTCFRVHCKKMLLIKYGSPEFNYRNGQCELCEEGYSNLANGSCVPANCQQSDTDFRCVKCKQGFSRKVTSQTQSGGVCVANNCQQYENDYGCRVCKNGYAKSDSNSCIIKFMNFCPPSQYYSISQSRCQQISIGNCLIGTQTQSTKVECLQCNANYMLFQNECLSLTDCSSVDAVSGCTQCKPGYKIVKLGNDSSDRQGANVCRPKVQYCQEMSQDDIVVVCKICQSGYSLVTNLAPASSTSINKCVKLWPNCLQASLNGSCARCKEGLTPILNVCAMLTPNCIQYNDQNSGRCSKCQPGYYLAMGGQCQKNPEYCRAADQNGICLSCITGYQFYNSKCFKPVKNCLTYFTNGYCSKCDATYFVYMNLAIGSITCEKLPPLCQNASFSGDCTLCLPGYIPYKNKCVRPVQNCKSYSESGVCQQCQNPYLLKLPINSCVNP